MTIQTHYDRLGGEEKLRQLVDRFYDLMDSEPESNGIHKLHRRIAPCKTLE